MRAKSNSRLMTGSGFTLIELLVVIAIIGILAALLFPVFARTREGVRQAQCMSQMHEIWQSLAIYREDNQRYPVVLSSYGQAVSLMNATNKPLGTAKLIKDFSIFICPDSTNKDPNALVSAPQVVWPNAPNVNQSLPITNSYYSYDSYDTGPQINASGAVNPGVFEIHYSLDWTGATGPNDAPNQLKYPDPPTNSTVVTWCTYHVAIAQGNMVPVILLSGTVKPIPMSQFVNVGPLGFSN